MADVDIDRTLEGSRVPVIQNRRKLIARNNPPRRSQKPIEDIEFERSHIHPAAAFPDFACLGIQPDVAYLDNRSRRRP